MKRIPGGPVRLACLLIVAVQSFLLVRAIESPGSGRPHQVPVTITAPAVVAQSLADQANTLPGRPFAVRPAPGSEDGENLRPARLDVASGLSVAALFVDLSGTRDVLLLNPHRDIRLNESVVAGARAVEISYGRTVSVQYSNQDDEAPGQARADNFTLVASMAGFLFILVISLFRGPVSPTLRRGVRRVVLVAGYSLLTGLLLVTMPWTSLPGPLLKLTAIGTSAVFIAAVGTLALEALAGLAGLGLAVAAFLVLAQPLLTRTDPYLQPDPWPALNSWTPTGATLDAVNAAAYFKGSSGLRPLLVLTMWLVLAVAVLLTSRGVRARFGVGVAAEQPASPTPTSRRDPQVVPWRWQVVALVLPLALVLVAVVAAVPESPRRVAALASKASETSCVGTGKVRNVADLNRIAGQLRGSPSFQGGDVGADVSLQDGRSLWVFGDTLRDDHFDGQKLVRNSMLMIEPGCLSVVLPHDHGALIPDREKRLGDTRKPVGYWPMSIGRIERPGYDLVCVATQRVRTTGGDVFGFENLGPSMAIFIVPRGGTPQLIAQRDIGPDDTSKTRPTWGAAAAVVDEEGETVGGAGQHATARWVYLYGTATPGQKDVFGYSLQVARVHPDDILNASRWRYWDGRNWVSAAGKAAVLIPAQGGVSQTLSVFEQDGTWYALSKQDEFLGSDLTVWTAPAPTGPFTRRAPLAHLPSDTVTGLLRYMPLAHPDVLPEAGSMVVSYSRNSTDFGKVLDDPLLYRPRFLRVNLPVS